IFKMLFETLFKKNSYWTFSRIMEINKNNNWNSTFFFLAKCFENTSYRYNIGTKKFKKLFKAISEQDHEIELHSSLNSFNNHSRVKKELHKLKYFSDNDIYGVRQHHLKLLFPEAFSFFSGLHFNYDSSMAYSKSAGYRAATSLPYPAFINSEKTLYEIPFTFFDYHLNRMDKWEEYFESSIRHIENIEGFFHILWHPSNIAEPPLNEKFFNIIKMLYEKNKNSCNFSLGNMLKWHKKWNDLKVKIKNNSNSTYNISFDTDEFINGLGIIIIGAKAEIITDPDEINTSKSRFSSEFYLNLESNKPFQLEIKIQQ
ncbi:MAG: hypothetical protein KAR38_13245, partial [Calditrichia bacterium]|nr:hypothetical protein [Calditrichia bacterium]